MKYACIARYREDYPVTLMCRVLAVSRSGLYAWLSRAPSAQAERRAEMMTAVEGLYYAYKCRYGAPRLTQELRDAGVACSEYHIAKL